MMKNIEAIKNELKSPWQGTKKTKKYIKEEILQQYNLYQMPIDLEQLAENEGFTIFYHNDKTCDGYIYISEENPFHHNGKDYPRMISLNINQSSARQRFTLAHELAHYFLDYDSNQDKPFLEERDENVFNVAPNETIMNNFASELLMPYEMIDAFVKMAQDDFSELIDIANPALISTVAKSFNVSNAAAKVRLEKLKRGY